MGRPPDELEQARRVLEAEAEAVSRLAGEIGEVFTAALDALERCVEAGGSVLVTGLGKSGLIGGKIASTLSSLGIPSHAVHPTEAAHGDLGRFRPCDAVICLSFSGETAEVVNLAAILRQDGLPIISITGDAAGGAPTSLERLATVALRLPIAEEAGAPTYVAPTSSTTATLALGDALAICLARRRNFTDRDFAKRHPGGALGNRLRPVTDALRARVGESLVLIPQDATVGEALRMAQSGGRRPGAMLVVDRTGRLAGIFTDGDLRRLVCRDPQELARPIREVMTRSPRTLQATATLDDAVLLFREHRQDEIPVIDEGGHPVGLLDVQDLVTLRLVSEQ